jgi:hypothetical protein
VIGLLLAACFLTPLAVPDGGSEAVAAAGTDWIIESIAPCGLHHDLAVDGAGAPHVLFSNCRGWESCFPCDAGGPRLTYATRADTGWILETVSLDPTGDHLTIILDGAATPHIAFQDTNRQMHYGFREVAGWQLENLYHETLLRYRASPSLALDSGGQPHIAFIQGERIVYAHKSGGVWTEEPVTGSTLDNWSARAAIAFDTAGILHIGSWMYYTSAVYFTRGGAGWTYETLNGDIGWNAWMVLDPSDAAHFVLHGHAGISYATNGDGTWFEEVIDPSGTNDDDDIALDPSGRPFVAYCVSELVTWDPPYLYDLSLVLAWQDAGGWRRELVATANAVDFWSMKPRLEIDPSGMTHLLFYNPQTEELVYAVRPSPSPLTDVLPAPAEELLVITPNPFNPVTTIRFRLNAPQVARVGICDLKGRLVAELAHGSFPVGEHEISWSGRNRDGRAAPSGCYFVRVESERGSISRKAILVR